MVALKAKDKRPLPGQKPPESTTIFCFMYDHSDIIGGELVEEWAPAGCKRRAVVNDVYLPEGWNYHGQFLLCSGCEQRWIARYEQQLDIRKLMSGDE